jgi:hypothetical protein
MNVQAVISEQTIAPVGTPFLDVTTYHPCYGLVIPSAAGPIRLDHLVVSRYGLFVVETCRHGGWIIGDARFPQWTSVYPGGARGHFPNPLLAGDDLARALADVLEVPRRTVLPVIVFRGECELADILPENVVKGSPAGYIRGRRQEFFREEEVSELRLKLKHLERKSSAAPHHGDGETF